ncbi:MAG: HAMP domain-containing sensor histidine kinase, partial [Pseudomonadota bacterium]
ADAALADPRGGVAHRSGLEWTIEAADEILSTFNALLLIAKLEAGALDRSREPLDLSVLVKDVSELYEPVAEDAGLILNCNVSGITKPVFGNRQLVGQAIANLVDNAIKYSADLEPKLTDRVIDDQSSCHQLDGGVASSMTDVRDGHRLSLVERASCQRRVQIGLFDHAKDIEIRVDDCGPGIAVEDRQRVLERFVRLEKSRTQPGTGLGLSLVAAVARLHGGRIELGDNAPGLRVGFFLPKPESV